MVIYMYISSLTIVITPLIPAAYGGIYRSTFSTLLTICVLSYILASMCYIDSLMDGAGAHPPLLLHTMVLQVLLCIFYNYILCIFNISPQSVVNFRLTIFNATSHSKFHILCGTLWLLHIYIFYTKYWLFLWSYTAIIISVLPIAGRLSTDSLYSIVFVVVVHIICTLW